MTDTWLQPDVHMRSNTITEMASLHPRFPDTHTMHDTEEVSGTPKGQVPARDSTPRIRELALDVHGHAASGHGVPPAFEFSCRPRYLHALPL